jgi:hypothetical protein
MEGPAPGFLTLASLRIEMDATFIIVIYGFEYNVRDGRTGAILRLHPWSGVD